MCLESKRFLPFISCKKRKVWKVVINKNGEYISPYLRSPIVEKAEGRFIFPFKRNYRSKFEIGKGMIHAYISREDACIMKMYLDALNLGDIKIITAYIPPFTRYYVGIDGDICAKRMIYEDIS